jgi:serine/threonine protein kinase
MLCADNVMLTSLDEDSSVKLIDFGMMVSLDWPSESMTGFSIMGTPGYFAPESLTKVQFISIFIVIIIYIFYA